MLRAAELDDLPDVQRLYGVLHPDEPPVPVDEGRRILQRTIDTPGTDILVLEDDGAVVATACLVVVPNLTREGRPWAVVENVAVDASVQRRGVGRRLMAQVMQLAWDAGCYKVMLQTSATGADVHAFYRECGLTSQTKTAFMAYAPGRPPVGAAR
ncbi:GNAT family N-acetyltransferase [Cellulomonas sp. S1-8]|uniref:GNAT family N-acetyltransferase n=1 Tax=Cellulomonas sp. S1-8 TaxID=2904790 RepID=UPI002242EDB5|nr:GNAT family N-acetyltransferase [Cellulomonas sp. S1-8]UZN03633.1 GNAT family N-acetyltransferase [Cellulomonas sp. S1-8]